MARIEVKVENQLFRFLPRGGIDADRVVSELGAVKSGDYAIRQLANPPVTLLVDGDGGIIVHGTSRDEVARSVCRELILSLGEPEDGIRTERGSIQASCDFGRSIDLERAADALSAVKMEPTLDAVRISDGRHDVEMIVFRGGRCIVTRALASRIANRAVQYWDSRFERARLYV